VQHGRNGWLLPVDDEAAFVQQAAQLGQAPDTVRQAAAPARAQVAPLDWAQIARQVEEIFLRSMA
jgi:glycosyltransferase involved in cell wall biosynthesis